MKKLMVLVLAVVLMAAVAYASGFAVTQRTGEYNVAVSVDSPHVGNNVMGIAITDASGRAITDAKVLVNYSMPAMPGMPSANYKAVALLRGTTYAAAFNPSMSGAWNVAVKITRSGRTSTAKFNIDAQ